MQITRMDCRETVFILRFNSSSNKMIVLVDIHLIVHKSVRKLYLFCSDQEYR